MNIIRTKDDLFSIPPEKKTKHDNGVPTHKAVYCTIRLYFELLMKHLYPCPLIDTVMNEPSLDEIIDSNDKCNRLDRNDLKKKQGILRTIFKGRPIPDLSLVVKEKWRMVKGGKNFCKVLAVNDGGHRSRTVLEFKLGLFRTSSDTFFTSEKGIMHNISNMTYELIQNKYPEAIEQFEDYELLLTIQWNLNAKQRKEDFDDRNTSTSAQNQEARTAYDDNVIADAVRNCVRVVEGEENPNPQHKLFLNNKTLGFKNTKMIHDEIVAKIMKMNYNESASANLEQPKLDEFYLLGSFAGSDNGELHSKRTVFKKILKDTYIVLDFLDGVLQAWPDKIYKKNEHVVHALLRWYFQYTTDLKHKHATFIYNDKVKINYKEFAMQFALKIMKKNGEDNSLKVWIKGTQERTKFDVFKGFLGQFQDGEKTKLSIGWIMEDFYSSVPNIEAEANFGITHCDSRVAFKQRDIVDRWVSLVNKDDLGKDIDINHVRGDHDIPRSWGILQGGITDPETNLKILHYDDNRAKSDKFTFNEYVEEIKKNDKKVA